MLAAGGSIELEYLQDDTMVQLTIAYQGETETFNVTCSEVWAANVKKRANQNKITTWMTKLEEGVAHADLTVIEEIYNYNGKIKTSNYMHKSDGYYIDVTIRYNNEIITKTIKGPEGTIENLWDLYGEV